MKSILRIYHCITRFIKSLFYTLGLINPFAIFAKHWFITLVLFGLFFNTAALLYEPNKNFSVQMAYRTWYLDWRFWPEWMSKICWLLPWWVACLLLVKILFPVHHRRFFLRPRIYRLCVHAFYLYYIDGIWRKATNTPFSIYTSLALRFYKHYTLEIHILLGLLLVAGLGFLLWLRRKRLQNSQTFAHAGIILFVVVGVVYTYTVVYSQPQQATKPEMKASAAKKPVTKSPTTKTAAPAHVYQYNIQSRNDLEQLAPKQIKELVTEENRFERRGDKKQLDGPMVHLFDENEFVYNGGKYEDSTIKYRLFSPRKPKRGKKYPLAIFLHGIGEAGDDNAHSLLYLNNLLPLMVGPEKEDFYMLVLQCPKNNRHWSFASTKDGTLDVLDALVDKLIEELPIEPRQLSLFGLSSGGFGVWLYALHRPEKFAAACPAPGNAPALLSNIRQLVHTRFWSFRGMSDKSVPAVPIQKLNDCLNANGGYAKLTEIDRAGHNVWMPAMRKYDCFRWMIKQKRQGWFAPLPEREQFKTWSNADSWRLFLMPFVIAASLLCISCMPLFSWGCEAFQRCVFCNSLYPKIDNGGVIEEEFRIWTDASGKRTMKAKFIGFAKGKIIIEKEDGKRLATMAKYFSPKDLVYLKEKWSQATAENTSRKGGNEP